MLLQLALLTNSHSSRTEASMQLTILLLGKRSSNILTHTFTDVWECGCFCCICIYISVCMCLCYTMAEGVLHLFYSLTGFWGPVLRGHCRCVCVCPSIFLHTTFFKCFKVSLTSVDIVQIPQRCRLPESSSPIGPK